MTSYNIDMINRLFQQAPEQLRQLPIGIFDSGFGGISMLAELLHDLPQEKYLYFADSAHAPYGIRSKENVRELTLQIVENLSKQGIKALVVACNTATSAAINDIRSRLLIPVVGMEPALKPAVEQHLPERIAVLATPMTLHEAKFHDLLHRCQQGSEIVPIPCRGLADLIEQMHYDDQQAHAYLHNLFAEFDINAQNTSAVVLGCTHYLFVRNAIKSILGEKIQILDGNKGTARRLIQLLRQSDLLLPTIQENISVSQSADIDISQHVSWHTSGKPDIIIPQCRRLLSTAMHMLLH